MENCLQNFIDLSNTWNKKTALIKFSFIELFINLHCHVFFFRNTKYSSFFPQKGIQ